MNTHVAVLAAGKGTRMKSALPKVLHRVAGLPMIDHVLATARLLHPQSTIVVIGHMADSVRAALAHHQNLAFVVQEPQLGTAHALLTTEGALKSASGTLILLSGDVPLLSEQTLLTLVDRHTRSRAAATVVTAIVDNPHGYGRIVRSGEQIARIVEEKDATPTERTIQEINSGIYAFALDGLFDAVRSIAAENAQREYYLPDLVAIYRRQGRPVETVVVPRADEILGINSRAELAAVSRIVRDEKNRALMAAGVTLEDPATAYIDRDVTVGADTIIHPGVSLEGSTSVGSGCEIHSGSRLVNTRVGDRVTILNHCVINDSVIANDATIGPFAHLRTAVDVGDGARIGNFVELKKTVLGKGSKAAHLAYLGDASIGEKVNIGAGTITCNYDGERKNQTTIEDEVFVGSNATLVAPVTIAKGSYIGAGSTISKDTPPGQLTVARAKQVSLPAWKPARKKG